MIVGDYYINNYFLAFIVSLVVGGLAVAAGVPSIIDGDTSPENTSPEYDVSLLGDSTAPGSSQVIRLAKENGSVVPGAEVFVNGQQVGQTGESGEIVFEVPDSNNLTVSASKSNSEVTETFEINDSGQDDSSERDSRADNSNGEDQGSEDDSEGSDRQQDGKSDDNQENNTQKENDTDLENGTSQSIFIEKVSPENSELSSSSFEMILDLGANSSTYQVSLGGEEKLSGEIDGNKTVNSSLEMPRNGTVGLYVEILKNEEVKASQNYSITYNSGSDGGGSDNDSEVENNVTADLSVKEQVNVGKQFTLDASSSTGDIENYTWEFGDGSSEVTQSSETSHSYSSEGDYNVFLFVEGPNGSVDNTTATVTAQKDSSSSKAPEINFVSPVDGFETDQSSLGYEFDVENASDSSTYSILIDGSDVSSGGLKQGTDSVQETVNIPSELFNTSIEVEHDGETYSSDKRTVNATEASANEPEFTLDNPGEAEVVETLDSQTSVDFEYEITDRKWATSANLTVTRDGNKVEERPVSVAAGNYTEEVSGLDPGSYNYEIVLTDGDKTDSKSNDFIIEETEPTYIVDSQSTNLYDNGYEVNFTIDVDVDQLVEIRGKITNSSGNMIKEGSGFVEGEETFKFSKTFEDPATYKWYVVMNKDGNQVNSTSDNKKSFETTQSRPNNK